MADLFCCPSVLVKKNGKKSSVKLGCSHKEAKVFSVTSTNAKEITFFGRKIWKKVSPILPRFNMVSQNYFTLQWPPLNRITLGQDKNDNNN